MPVTRKTRTSKGVESFGPEIFEALIQGSKREIVLPLPYRKAVHHRQRANSLRSAMQKSNHEQYKIVAQTTIRIVWGVEAGYEAVPEKKSSQNVRFPLDKDTPAKLIISPADSEFGEALRKAGVNIRPLNTDPVVEPAPPVSDVGSDILQQYLSKEPSDATDK